VNINPYDSLFSAQTSLAQWSKENVSSIFEAEEERIILNLKQNKRIKILLGSFD